MHKTVWAGFMNMEKVSSKITHKPPSGIVNQRNKETWGQNRLGLLYEEGKSVQLDYTQASEWYRQSAEQGDVNAQANLANLYEKGKASNKTCLLLRLVFAGIKTKEGNADAQNAVKVHQEKTNKRTELKEGEKIAEEWQRRIEANKKK